ncbi:hypothetical protein NQ317_013874 [Molorchus minor]|uniref:Chromo domain-containing protein n=1 Tax=Molorchus minor TaxID=1323400 RepID=A0ABQ9K5W2_9CUCU|nr:hypothetical protein NQ317_013874 [Molorchus minor]
MDEITDVPSDADQLPALDAAASAGNDTDADFLPAVPVNTTDTADNIDTYSGISTASTERATDASSLTTDILTDILNEVTETPDETSNSEVTAIETPADSDDIVKPSDVLPEVVSNASVSDALTSMDVTQSVEESTIGNAEGKADTSASATTVFENKEVFVDVSKPVSAVCELEEELKRLHEGDPIENVPTESIQKESTHDNNVQEEQPTAKSDPEEIQSVVEEAETSQEINEVLDPVEMLTAADDATKDPVLIKRAQEDLKKIDVLVCGTCHEVVHFVEEFKQHKLSRCRGKSHLVSICEGETKPQVWGFTLWKNKQAKMFENAEKMPSSWLIYQKWCKLPQIDKDAWITAGQTLQFCTKIGTAKVQEFKVKAQLNQEEQDPLALDGFDSNKENKQSTTEVMKKTVVKPIKLNNDVTILPSPKNSESNSNKAMRTVRSTEKHEYVVERIVAKRFSPKRKTWEYQIKWENFPSEQNTWEPISNLNHCKQMVEEFEQQLKRLKAEKAKQLAAAMSPKPRGKPVKIGQVMSTPGSSFRADSTPGRPQRTCKQKALNQVKAWCGNISDNEAGVKRAFENDDSDDSFEKKIKLEDYSDDSDIDIKPKVPQYKKITPKSPTVQVIKNGIGKSSPLPQNILIPDANGVVRINQKQLPSLSTGVYIMSKTAGIIKLDSTTSKVATSGGQTIVKVAPKIGQTQIKIIIHTTPKQLAQPPKTYKPVITKVKKPPEGTPKSIATKIIVKPKEEPKKPEPSPPQPPPKLPNDESDDGLEELPFPDEIPLPAPDSPPADFVLDPVTGKIAGQEYPETVPEMPIVKPEVDESSLDNIVKLAAADITEDDLKNETPMETDPLDQEDDDDDDDDIPTPIRKTEPITKVKRLVTSTAPVKVTMTPTLVRRDPPMFKKTFGSSTILRKSLTNTSTPRPPQRILNQTISSRAQNVSSVVRMTPQISTLGRTKPLAPKPRFNIASPSNVIRAQHEVSPKNVYSKQTVSGGMRKIGNTTIRSTAASFTGHKPQARIMQTSIVNRVSPQKKESLLVRTQPKEKTPVVLAKPKTVISMPSLMGDDDNSLSPPTTPVSEKSTPPVTTTVAAAVVASPTTSSATSAAANPEPPAEASTASSTETPAITDLSSFTLADNDNPIFITGDDGTVYQVAGQNEQGQTILLTQGSDGQQQCLLVTNEVAEAMEATTEEPQADISVPEVSTDVTEPLSVKTDDTSDQVVAQVVRAEPPSPGGTHKVVVMLPDGNLMVTQVSPEEYASLELE